MKRSLSVNVLLLISGIFCFAQKSNTALLIIDIQDFYFPGGKTELFEPARAAGNTALLLAKFREKELPVIFIRHNSEPGGSINETVKPLATEKVISKNEINSFKGTDLNDYLKMLSVDTLVICGMQTHMCVEAAVQRNILTGYKYLNIRQTKNRRV